MGKTGYISMKINVPKLTPSSKKRVYCPYCIYNEKYIPMVYDFENRMWHCNLCNETLKKSEDPVESGKLVAGNEASYTKPYVKSIDFTKKTKPIVQDTYNNPLDAWKNDEIS